MPTSIQQIALRLEHRRVRFHLQEKNNRIILSYATENYQNTEDERSVRVLIDVLDDGQYVTVYAPGCFAVPAGEHAHALLEAADAANRASHLVKWKYDHARNALLPAVDIVVQDARFSSGQITVSLTVLLAAIEEMYLFLHGSE
ncbi:MAG: hypothetical protein O3C57_03550 [Verrucomicrobia bacterium]|nr:hypothetical protein [Verrucomicrobiota bacterium]